MAIRWLSPLACIGFMTACASVPVGSHQPTADTVITLRDSGIAPLNVGDFKLAAGAKPAIDKSVTMRGNPIKPPNGAASFSQYLRESLIADLKSAGKFDAASPLTIQGEVTENQLNAAGISVASALLAAHFTVRRGSEVVYDKVLRQDSQWKSSFVAAIAFPDALNHFTEQFTRLLSQLYADADFRKASSRGP